MAKLHFKKPRRIAPRLASGDSRVSCGHGLPENIKKALQMIAVARGQSLSWVLEQELIKRFNLERPEYRLPKKKTAEEIAAERGTLRQKAG